MVMMKVSFEGSGPIFKRDVPAWVDKAITSAVQELVDKGEERLNEVLRPQPQGVYLSVGAAKEGQASTGNYRRNLHTKVLGLQGIITDGNVVYGPWLEGIDSRNMTTRFKGYAAFRRTKDFIDKLRQKVLKSHVERLVRKLNGI
jgi:hypothetical protein